MEETTIGKLVFSGHFYGRELELGQLKEVMSYSRVSGVELVMIGGYSGTGKSTLVKRFARDFPGYFISGKADELTAQPYTLFVDALTGFCEQLVQGPEGELLRMKAAILQAVGHEGKVLTDLIPGLVQVIGEQTAADETASKTNSLHRLQYIFGEFMRAVCTKERPLLLFLDDCQWADQPTLDLLSKLVLDPQLKHLMIVGAYRDNEVGKDHPLALTLNSICNQGRAFLTINTGNLSLEDVKALVGDALSQDGDDVNTLAEVVFEKTLGNIFYTKAALELLGRKEVLKYSYSDMQWKFDLNQVTEEMHISDNVVSMVVARLEGLDQALQLVLVTAAFLGFSFNIETLRSLLEAREAQEALDQLQKLLDVAVAEGFLSNMMGSVIYHFSHDRIMEAALSLVPTEVRDELSLLLGRRLVDSTATDPNLVFVAVDRLNSVPITLLSKEMSIVELVELNKAAGDRSIRLSAFAPAGAYLRQGVALIEREANRWDSYYDLCLRLYNAAADVEFAFGDFTLAKRFADEVIYNARTFDDKLPAMMSLSDGLGMREKHADALEIDVEILEHYGEMPKHCNMLNMLIQVSKLKKRFAKLSDADVLALPLINDPIKLNIVAVRSKLAIRAWYCKRVALFVLCVIRNVNMTLDHGLSQTGAFSLVGVGTIMYGNLGEEELGIRLALLSKEVMKATNAKKYEAKILFTASNYINPWCQPLTKVLEDCNTCYKSGMESGDIEFGFFGYGLYSVLSYVSGLNLPATLADLEVYLGICKQYQVEAVHAVLSALQDLILGLTGQGMNRAQLAAAAEEIPRGGSADASLTLELADKCTAYLQLAYYLGDYQLADEMLEEAKIYGATNLSFYYVTTLNLFSVLIAAALYRETKKKKYQARAKASIASMKKLMKGKGINITHKYVLMQAEYAATFSRRASQKEIKDLFDRAIAAASRGGVMHEAALANELAGEYSLRIRDEFWAIHYLTPAHERFSSWGAKAIVKRLLETRGHYITKEEQARMGTARKGRVIMANDAVKMHSTIDTRRSTEDCVSVSGNSQVFQPDSGSGHFSSMTDPFGGRTSFSSDHESLGMASNSNGGGALSSIASLSGSIGSRGTEMSPLASPS